MDQYIGKLLDNRYEILECVGTGGMAVVYKARCHRLNRLVAVKILRPDLAQDAEFRRRFHDESQAVAMLSHPNIVSVYDVSRSDDLEYLVMELIDGITLKQYMQKKGTPLNWREALHFITQIMKGLSHAHSRGIIHRDIKPHNVMVLRDGSVKVADFGIARLASAAQSTLTQEALGSVHYISPEQARGSRIDARSDIYSAGVVLYEMITGRLPYEGDTPVSVAIQHINSIPLPPRDINPDIPEALEAITMKAMASDVDKRYVSADAMLADLEEFRKNPNINFEYTQEDLSPELSLDEPTQVHRTGDLTPSQRRRRRRQPEFDDEQDEEDDYPDRHRGNGPWPILLAVGAILVFVIGVVYFLWTALFSNLLNDRGTEYTVPNLIGMTVDQINADIAAGEIDSVFTIVVGQTVEDDAPAGQVINQDPQANEKKKGEEITITVDVSAGSEQLTMPGVENQEYRTVLGLLQDTMGLKVNQEYENSEEVTRNYVIRSEPLEGTNLEPGQEVTIVVSLGPKEREVTVPDFLNQSIDRVLEQLDTLNLTPDVQEVENAEVEKGRVVYQSIAPSTQVLEGSTIILHISSGPVDNEDPNDIETNQPTQEPTVSPSQPVTSPEPSQPVMVTSKTVQLDLSNYTDTVTVRIMVGGERQYDSPVDPGIGTFIRTITGTGQQKVEVFVNDEVVMSYTEDFTQ